MRFFVGITGASSVIIGIRLVEELSKYGRVYYSLTRVAKKILSLEEIDFKAPPDSIEVEENDFTAPISSGSFRLKATIIAPCSMGTLGRIANGISLNIIERSADVALKEKWPLVIVPRETPFSVIHLENMLKLAKCGATILPPMITFYNKPKTVRDMVDFIVGKILDILGIENNLFKRWRCDLKEEE
ncbi:MAG: UbiX family flavin prenyltransferase [candidate division WOR-3 bacterium]